MKKKLFLIPIIVMLCIVYINFNRNNVIVNKKIYTEGNNDTVYIDWMKSDKTRGQLKNVFFEDDGYVAVGTETDPTGGSLQLKYVVKYNFDGDVLWQKDLESYLYCFNYSIKLKDGYLLLGSSKVNYTEQASIVKVDKNWNFIWQKNYDGNISDKLYSALEVEDGYVIAGRLENFAYIMKTNYNGDIIWKRRFDASDAYATFSSIIETNDGYVAVGNRYSENNYYDAITLKTSKNGDIIWQKEWGGLGYDDFQTIIDEEDGYIVFGESYKNPFAAYGEIKESEGGTGIVIVKYSKDGNILWEKVERPIDSDGKSYVESAIKDDNGYVVVGAETGSWGRMHAMISNFDKNGDLVWKKHFSNGSPCYLNYVVKIDGGYVAAGVVKSPNREFIVKFSNQFKIENKINEVINSNIVYKNYNMGDMIKYRGEDYYIVGEDSSNNNYLTLLKSEPLTNEDLDKFSSEIKFEKGEKYGLVPYYSSSTCNSKDNKSGCTNQYEYSNIKKILDNWASEFNDDLIEVDGYKVRLLKYYNVYAASTDDGSCIHYIDVPNWLYNNYYSYWLMNTIDDKEDSVIAFGNDSTMCTREVYKAKAVRPVINLKKCVVEDNCSVDEPEKNIEDKEPEKPIIETKVEHEKEPEKEKTIIKAENTFKTVSYVIIIIGSLLIIGGYIFYKKIKKINN